MDLNRGKNSIKVFNQNKQLMYDSAFTVEKVRGLLNITHKDYYINTQYYGYGLNKDSLLAAKPGIEIDKKHYLGDVQKTSKLYNENFYYNLDEDYDKLIKNVANTAVEHSIKEAAIAIAAALLAGPAFAQDAAARGPGRGGALALLRRAHHRTDAFGQHDARSDAGKGFHERHCVLR